MAGYVTVTITSAPNPGSGPANATVKVKSMDNYKGDVDMEYSATQATCSPGSEELHLTSGQSQTRTLTLDATTGNPGNLTAEGTDDYQVIAEDTASIQVTQ